MKRSIARLILLAILVFPATFLVSCRKPFHQETERYFFVSVNIALPYWQEAKAGFMDSARVLGVKAEFLGPDSYSPEEELEAFKKAVDRRPAGILISRSPRALQGRHRCCRQGWDSRDLR
jgi:ribose transport system substrate-binding protein